MSAKAGGMPRGPAKPSYQADRPYLQDLVRVQLAELEREGLTHGGMGSRTRQQARWAQRPGDKRGDHNHQMDKVRLGHSGLIWPFL
jgi:hypothetical protein